MENGISNGATGTCCHDTRPWTDDEMGRDCVNSFSILSSIVSCYHIDAQTNVQNPFNRLIEKSDEVSCSVFPFSVSATLTQLLLKSIPYTIMMLKVRHQDDYLLNQEWGIGIRDSISTLFTLDQVAGHNELKV
jgi:hypothetical protein